MSQLEISNFSPETLLEESERNEFVPSLDLSRRTRIVCLGGGTGLPVVLKGLSNRAEPKASDPGLEITAIVAMSDDGGSSGRLRRRFGVLPPGDIRNCLVALAGGDRELLRVFQHRFSGSRELGGHAVGNLLLAAMAELKGNFMEAVRLSSRLLNVRGTVLPSTLTSVQLVAEMTDETVVVGESNIAKAGRAVRRVSLSPRSPAPVEGTIEAIHRADLIAIGPGSLYSSLLPNLLVDGIAEALLQTRALKVMVANLMTQPGETDGMDCVDHLKAVADHVGPLVDIVLVNCTRPDASLLHWYGNRGSKLVATDRRALIHAGVVPVEANLLKEGRRIRHDSKKVANCLVKLARRGL